MKYFVYLVFVCFFGANLTNAQYARCMNPNQRAGLCVHIRECQSLLSVLSQTNLSPSEKQFIKESSCGLGADNKPFVCCTRDTGYARGARQTPSFADYDYDFGWNAAATTSAPRTSLFPGQSIVPWSFGNERSFDRNLDRRQPQQGDGGSLLPQPPTCGGVTIENKIYGGEDAALNEFPWIVLLEYRRLAGNGLSTSCAGSLINQRYVLTAAHCLTGRIVREIGPLASVRLGEHNTRSSTGQRVGFEEAHPHELYKETAPNQVHDIGLVRLDRNVRYSDSIKPVCLTSVVAPETKQAGQKYTVVGWGRTLQSSRSSIKQKLEVSFVEPEQCKRKFGERKISIVSTQMCAGGQYAQDSCDGDSGGPLMRFRANSWVLEGIVSFGYKCGLKDWPGVYTSVAAYDIWIKQNIRA